MNWDQQHYEWQDTFLQNRPNSDLQNRPNSDNYLIQNGLVAFTNELMHYCNLGEKYVMRFSLKELLIIEDELIESMSSIAAKTTVHSAFRLAKEQRLRTRTLTHRIQNQIRQRNSTFKDMQEVKDLLDYKRYMLKNSHIHGDYNENKIQNTKTQ